MNKDQLRKLYKDIRNNINNKAEKSLVINQKVISSLYFKQSNIIGLYVNISSEVDTSLLINICLKDKVLALPRVNGDTMDFYLINSINDLKEGSFHILEPKDYCQKIDVNDLDLVIVPGIVFDHDNYRIGYGKGYYDKYLQNYQHIAIGIAYSKQIVELIDHDEYDIKLIDVYTEDD